MAPRATTPAVLLGIDPSLRGTGWGVLRVEGPRRTVLAWGVIHHPPALRPSLCLASIRRTLAEVIAAHQPDEVAIEGLFFAQNLRTAIMMGQARGAALVAAAEAGLEIFEYAPRRVKQGVVGTGAAAKNQVGFMVRALLGLRETPEPDAADALAIALTHANARGGTVAQKSL